MTDLTQPFAAAEQAWRRELPAQWDARFVAAAACADGRIAAASDSGCTASLAACLQALRTAVPDCRPGDVLITNDVYSGSTHPTELTAATPLAHGGGVAGWAMARIELPDLGGWDLGGYSPRALDIWSEAARIVPAIVFRGGKPRREVLDMLQLNSRTPRLNLACVGSLSHALLGMASALAPAAAALPSLADAAEERARAALGRVEQGQGKAMLSAPGVDPLAISVRFLPGAQRLSVSFPGLPEASQSPLNATRAMTLDALASAIAATLRIDPQAAVALHRLIDLQLAEDRLLSAARRRPAGWARALTAHAVFQAACDALGASGEAGWASRDPHFDAASGRIAAARRKFIEALEQGM
jgi:N-methylhydantoinase B/oxoprolinase/acetone carboxylase alpha subunit